MRCSVAALALLLVTHASAFAPPPIAPSRHRALLSNLALAPDTDELSVEAIGDLSFRELQSECRERGLSPEGTTGALRARIREVICPVDPFTGEEECPAPTV